MQREREREIYIYIYVYICIHICIHIEPVPWEKTENPGTSAAIEVKKAQTRTLFSAEPSEAARDICAYAHTP